MSNADTRSKRADRQRTSEELDLLASLLETDGPAMLLESSRIIAANDAAATMLGASAKDGLRGLDLRAFACGDDAFCATPHRDPRAECWHTLDRRKIDVSTIRVPVGRNLPPITLAMVSDVTEGRRTREALFESEARLRESQRLAQIGHWTLDLRTGVLEWSDEVYRFFEFDRETFEASYQAFLAMVHPQDRTNVDETFHASVELRTPYDVTHRVTMPDGRVKHARERGRTFYAPDGTPLRSIGTVQDVTLEIEREEQLRTAEHALDSSCAATAFANLTGTIRSVNPAFADLWKLIVPSAAQGRDLASFFAERDAFGRILFELAEHSSSVGTITARRDDDSTFVVEYVASVTRSPQGKPLGMLVHFLDVTERIRNETSLRESQERLKLVFDNSSDLIALLRTEGDRHVIEMANERMLSALREIASKTSTAADVPGQLLPFAEAIGDLSSPDTPLSTAARQAVSERRTVRLRTTLPALNRLFDCVFVPVLSDQAEVDRVLVTLHDITAETVAETTLSSTQALLLHAERLANIGSWQRDLQSDVSRWSPGMFRLLGFDPESKTPPTDAEVLARIHEDDRQRALENIEKNLSGHPVGQFEWRVTLPDREQRIIRGAAHGITDVHGRVAGITGFLQDITEQREAAERIRNQLEEKEVLLREVHHRVKNNLQIISSLLYLQGQDIDDLRIMSALEATRGRIAAMALVHEKLYSANDLGSVHIGSYARDLGLSLFAVFGIDPSRVTLTVEEPTFRIELDRAIPCGLIVNELLTNALKHAFPNDRQGTITLRFPSCDRHFGIEIEDDGVGVAQAPSSAPPMQGLGLKLLPRLAAQLGGTLEITSSAGTRARLIFPRQR